MIGMRLRPGGIPSEARETAKIWGKNPVQPSQAAYKMMAEDIMSDVANPESRYPNPPKESGPSPVKRPKYDQSLQRAEWVSGCSVAPARHDVIAGVVGRSHRPAGYRGCMCGRGHYPAPGLSGLSLSWTPPDIGGCFAGTVCTTKEGKETSEHATGYGNNQSICST
jgi:hypothetical protein